MSLCDQGQEWKVRDQSLLLAGGRKKGKAAVRRPFQERRHSRGDKLRRPVPTINAQAFSKFNSRRPKISTAIAEHVGPRRVFSYAARIPHPPERAVNSVKEPGAAPHPVLYFSFFGMVMLPQCARHGTFVRPIRFDEYERAGDHKADRAVFIRFVSSDADAQRDQLLRIPFTQRCFRRSRTYLF